MGRLRGEGGLEGGGGVERRGGAPCRAWQGEMLEKCC